ncbi:hypothetical protein FA13DRAFT_1799223 [Coprinellus micaceus]|uniref:Uncharacterized protein n=1 Tax=Coprinellus micaceus TaxID=71717 RepID=A0A4Y7SK24_COPMI|nr:hypothetical protein FA13DRAFT_1805462 [Coprinellus micaceus]TEB22112.1 hypothetical protein FA13DRAFT_1799223 [Coprinellus micaceus]
MQFKRALLFAAVALPTAFAAEAVKEGDVFTATRVIHTIIKESPYMVDRTTTVVWTAGPVISTTESATPIPETVETAPAS